MQETVTATVRVRRPGTTDPASRPAPEDLEEAARLLAERGFRVLRIGRFGVNVEADAALFRSELGLGPFSASVGVQRPRPVSPGLRDLVDLVEAAPAPEAFGG